MNQRLWNESVRFSQFSRIMKLSCPIWEGGLRQDRRLLPSSISKKVKERVKKRAVGHFVQSGNFARFCQVCEEVFD
jgi:hypothetical protein